MTASLGFVGLGNMGAAMAGRLIDAGFDTHVWNRSKLKTQALVERGAHEADSVADLFRECAIVVSMLSNDAAVDEAFADEVLVDGAGKFHVNMATVGIDTSRAITARHADHGVRYVAAPVLGRPEVAEVGALTIVVAGDPADIDEAQPAFDQIGKQTWRVGDKPERASLVKIGFNYTLIHSLQALGESVSLMERGGIDGQAFVDVLTDVAFSGSTYKGYGGIIAQRDYRPAAFTLELGLKDLSLAESAAEELGASLPTAPMMRRMFSEALDDPGLKDGDWSIIAEVIRRGPGAR